MLSLDPPEVVESGSSVPSGTLCMVWPRGDSEVVLHHLTRGTTLTSIIHAKININDTV